MNAIGKIWETASQSQNLQIWNSAGPEAGAATHGMGGNRSDFTPTRPKGTGGVVGGGPYQISTPLSDAAKAQVDASTACNATALRKQLKLPANATNAQVQAAFLQGLKLSADVWR